MSQSILQSCALVILLCAYCEGVSHVVFFMCVKYAQGQALRHFLEVNHQAEGIAQGEGCSEICNS